MTDELHLSPFLYDSEKVERRYARDGYGDGLVELGRKNTQVVALTADLAESTRVHTFEKEFPTRFIQVGIAEQNMLGVAAGLALSDKIPFVSSYVAFSPGRNWDQLRVSVCYSQANVKIFSSHVGLSVGPDGATHQGLEDLAMTRVLPHLTVIAPCDYWETRKATVAAGLHKGPVYTRFGRDKSAEMTTEATPFEVGKAYVMREGKDVSVIGCGPILYQALQAAAALEKEGISVEVINNHTIKPMDAKTILESIRKTKTVVTVEEHQVAGGMGSAVSELLAQRHPVPIEMVGMQDQFGESGAPEQLYKKYHLTAEDIVIAVKKVLARKSNHVM
jgi:transketolase